MTITEQSFIQKNFYIQLFEQQNSANFDYVKALGERYFEEQQRDVPKLNDIRFAQGEVYFALKDFEAAIFKWESIRDEREPWAKKNMADAYMELNQYGIAETIYKQIVAPSSVLEAEIDLQLFSLYALTDRKLEASEMMKQLVLRDPDYPDVTNLARLFFEEQGDVFSCVELAVNEALRTQQLDWVDIVLTYAEEEVTQAMEPGYFHSYLVLLFKLDVVRFERTMVQLWNNYQKDGRLLLWLEEVHRIFLFLDRDESVEWKELPTLFKTTFADILAGNYPVSAVKPVVPKLLTNWFAITHSNYFPVASAIVAWNEVFEQSIERPVVLQALEQLEHLDDSLITSTDLQRLFHAIVVWGADQEIEVSNKLSWMMSGLQDHETQQCLLLGTNMNDQKPLVEGFLQNELPTDTDTRITWYSDDPQTSLEEISSIATVTMQQDQPFSTGDTYIHVKQPLPLLRKTKSRLLSMPPFQGSVKDRSALLVHLHLADRLIFVLHHQQPLSELETQLLLQIRKHSPQLPVVFLVQEDWEVFVQERLTSIYPEARLISYRDPSSVDWEGIFTNKGTTKVDRREKELFFIHETLQYLAAKRVDQEEKMNDAIQLNKMMLAKVSAASVQLADVETATVAKFKKRVQQILEDTRLEMEATLPTILKDTAQIIKEDSDFSQLHDLLNQAMNERVDTYLHQTILPKLYVSLQQWVKYSKEELEQVRAHLSEMGASFNALYAEEKFSFDCNEQMIQDWRRDVGRLTSGITSERYDIFSKFNPVQFLLKSAGKLLGGIGQNKALLQGKYKQSVEGWDYSEVTAKVSKNVLTPFQLFALAIDRDMEEYFQSPRQELTVAAEEIVTKIEQLEKTLQKMYTQPEVFQEPLKLFEVHYRLLHVTVTKEKAKILV